MPYINNASRKNTEQKQKIIGIIFLPPRKYRVKQISSFDCSMIHLKLDKACSERMYAT